MKKALLFLTISFIYLISSIPIVNASSDSFYEAEYIDNIYMVRYDKSTKTKYYQKARMYKRTSDGKIAYCLQPFTTFNPNDNIYETASSLPNITEETLKKLKDIIGFGYGYKNHTDLKWYAITQLMIWQTVEPNNDFYFTDTLNGNKIEPYNKEITEINNLINESYILPSFSNQTFYGIVNKPINIIDNNNVLINYSIKPVQNINTEKINNSLTIKGTKEGCYDIPYIKYYNNNDKVLFYYNPNITSPDEYEKRAAEQQRLIEMLDVKRQIKYVAGEYEPQKFYDIARGREQLAEGGVRCFDCYRLRLEKTAEYMAANPGLYDYFATTLTLSPHKNAAKLNEIGYETAEKYGVEYLPSDFKKRGGYKRSIELSRIYGLYRQDYCGCEFSRRARELLQNEKI